MVLHKILATLVVFNLTTVCSKTDISFSDSTSEINNNCTCISNNLCADEFQDIILLKFGEQCENKDHVCCTKPVQNIYHREGCGTQRDNPITLKIIANENYETNFGEFPWMVMILHHLNETNYEGSPYYTTFCSGTLIHENVVLTAAHCAEKMDSSTFKLRAGEWDVATKTEPTPHQDREIEQIIFHPDYRKTRRMIINDIALIVTTEPFEFADNVEIACLPKRYEKITNNNCIASGWGKTDMNGPPQAKLRKVSLPIVPTHECEKLLRPKLGKKFNLHISFICAGGNLGYDTCQGDGGGPLICPIGTSNRFQQAGIISWGIGCGKPIPGVYSDVAYFRDWIDIEMEKLNFRTEYDYKTVLKKIL